MTIVYLSETGFTEKYATMLSKRCRMPLMPLAEALKTLEKGSPVVYLGWLRAGKIMGLKKAKRKFTLKAVAGVGIRPDVDNMVKTVCAMSGVPEDGGFYLPGGYAPDKLQGGKKKALSMVLNALSKKIKSQPALAPGQDELLRVFEHGGSFVSKRAISNMEIYVRTHRD